MSDLLSDPFSISGDYLDDIEDAIDAVTEMLEKLDRMQSLFPNILAMKREHTKTASKAFEVLKNVFLTILFVFLCIANILLEYISAPFATAVSSVIRIEKYLPIYICLYLH